MVQKKNGRLKEEIFVNKTVSMKVEQEITRCPQVVDYHHTMLSNARLTAR